MRYYALKWDLIMIRNYEVTFSDGSTEIIQAVSASQAKHKVTKPVVRCVLSRLDAFRNRKKSGPKDAAYVTPNVHLNETELAALWREQERTGESVSALIRRLIRGLGGVAV